MKNKKQKTAPMQNATLFMGQKLSTQIQIENALRENKAHLRAIPDNTADITYAVDLNGPRTTFFNANEFLGFSHAELESRDLCKYAVHPDDLQTVQALWAKLTATRLERCMRSNIVYKSKMAPGNGSPHQVFVSISLVPGRKVVEQTLQKIKAEVAHAHKLLLTLNQVVQTPQRARSLPEIYVAIQGQLAERDTTSRTWKGKNIVLLLYWWVQMFFMHISTMTTLLFSEIFRLMEPSPGKPQSLTHTAYFMFCENVSQVGT